MYYKEGTFYWGVKQAKITNAIICSYARYEAFLEACTNTGLAELIDVMPSEYVKANEVFHFDETGAYMRYEVNE